MIEILARIIPAPPDRPVVGGVNHPMRKITRDIAFGPHGWTPERAAKVTKLFDTMAPEWNERTTPERTSVLPDALERGDLNAQPGDLCLEIGSGTGSSTADLARHFARLVSLDLSKQMLRHAPDGPARSVQGDAARLPFGDATVDCLVLVNALLFPAEMTRVLASGGILIWVNSLGDATPIHLSSEDVDRALPGRWQGKASEAGWGTWCAMRRAV